MADAQLVQREWVQELLPDQARLRCRYTRRARRILQYAVQLEIRYRQAWQAVVRYDNAHGFCHRDDVHPDGSQDKTVIFAGDANDTFTRAVTEIQANWETHRDRFLSEVTRT